MEEVGRREGKPRRRRQDWKYEADREKREAKERRDRI